MGHTLIEKGKNFSSFEIPLLHKSVHIPWVLEPSDEGIDTMAYPSDSVSPVIIIPLLARDVVLNLPVHREC